MSDDWRLRIHLPDGGRGGLLATNLAAAQLDRELEDSLAERVAVSHDEDDVFVYAATRDEAERAGEVASAVAGQNGWQIRAELARWHPEAEDWEDPEKPLPAAANELAGEHAERIEQEREEFRERGYPDFEVRVHCRSRADAIDLAQRLRDEDIPSLRRWRYVLVGAADEDTAARLAERIQILAPAGAEVRTEGTGQAAIAVQPGNPFAVFGGIGV